MKNGVIGEGDRRRTWDSRLGMLVTCAEATVYGKKWGTRTSGSDQTPGSDMVLIRSDPASSITRTRRCSPSSVCTPPSTLLISWSKWSSTTAVRWYDWKASQGSIINHDDACSAAMLHIFTLEIRKWPVRRHRKRENARAAIRTDESHSVNQVSCSHR